MRSDFACPARQPHYNASMQRATILFLCSILSALVVAAQETAAGPEPPREGRLTGHILCGDTRLPARGAKVLVAPVPSESGSSEQHLGGGMAMTHTSNNGTFLVEHLGPGEYTVFAFYSGYLSPFFDLLALDKQPAKQQTLLGRLGTVEIHGSETVTFDLTLGRGAILAGRVLFSDGTPAISVPLTLEGATEAGNKPQNPKEIAAQEWTRQTFEKSQLTTDDRGHFRLVGLAPGKYRLATSEPVAASNYGEADAEGVSPLAEMGMISDPRSLHFYSNGTIHRAGATVYDLKAGDVVQGLEITLPLDAFHDVRGQVETADGKPAISGSLTLTDDSDAQLSYRTHVHKDGSFVLHQVPAGSYRLEVKGAGTEGNTGPQNNPVPTSKAPDNSGGNASLSVMVQDTDVSNVVVTIGGSGEQTSATLPIGATP